MQHVSVTSDAKQIHLLNKNNYRADNCSMLYLPTLSHFQAEVKELTSVLTYIGAQMLPNCSELP